jgi:uncharacterized protein (DUF58 family)
MQTDDLTIDIDEQLLKSRRPWYFLAAALLLLSLLLRQPLIFLAAAFMLIVASVPELWYRQALRHLLVKQQVNQRNLFFGEEVILSTRIENQKILPLPWLQVENKITPPLVAGSKQGRTAQIQKIDQDTLVSTWLLWSLQRVTRKQRLLCRARGLHVFGPIRLSSSDPFGWLETEVTIPAHATLLVYPLIAPLEALGFSSTHPLGEYSNQYPLLEDPLRIAGVRDYVIGDDPRRIHWKATARLGSLQSKLYEPSSLRRFLVLLDTWNYSKQHHGIDHDLQELTITIAASFALWALDEGYTVGLFANSSMLLASAELTDRQPLDLATALTTHISPPGVYVPFAADDSQYENILATLACLVADYNTPIERFIEKHDQMFAPGTTVVLVSAATSLNDPTIERLLDLRLQRAAIHLVLTGEQADAQQAERYGLPVYHPGGREKWHELTNHVRSAPNDIPGISSTPIHLD